MKTLFIGIALLALTAPAWAAEPPTVLGIGQKTSLQEAQEILKARDGSVRLHDPTLFGQQLMFTPPDLDGFGIFYSFDQDGLKDIQGDLYGTDASEERCLERFERVEKYLDLPNDLRRYRYEHRPRPSGIWKAVYHCFAGEGFLVNGVGFDGEEKNCSVHFNVDFTGSCENALEQQLKSNKIPREQVTKE